MAKIPTICQVQSQRAGKSLAAAIAPYSKAVAGVSGSRLQINCLRSTSLWILKNHFRRRLTHFKFGAHFLDLRGLLFQLGGENIHSLLLLSDG